MGQGPAVAASAASASAALSLTRTGSVWPATTTRARRSRASAVVTRRGLESQRDGRALTGRHLAKVGPRRVRVGIGLDLAVGDEQRRAVRRHRILTAIVDLNAYGYARASALLA